MKKLHYLMVGVVVWAFQAQAAVYTWVDEEGNTHYSDKPPPEEQAEVKNLDNVTLGLSVGDAPPKPADGENSAPPAAQQNAGNQSGNDQQKITKEQIFKQNCETAKNNLNILQNNKNVNIPDDSSPTGSRAISAEEHAVQLQQAQQQIDKFCQSGNAQAQN